MTRKTKDLALTAAAFFLVGMGASFRVFHLFASTLEAIPEASAMLRDKFDDDVSPAAGLARGFSLFFAHSASLPLAWLASNIIHDLVKKKKKREDQFVPARRKKEDRRKERDEERIQ